MRPGAIFISRPNGNCGYVVARFDGDQMRIAHSSDIASAKTLEREWLRGDFSFEAGVIRRLNCVHARISVAIPKFSVSL